MNFKFIHFISLVGLCLSTFSFAELNKKSGTVRVRVVYGDFSRLTGNHSSVPIAVLPDCEEGDRECEEKYRQLYGDIPHYDEKGRLVSGGSSFTGSPHSGSSRGGSMGPNASNSGHAGKNRVTAPKKKESILGKAVNVVKDVVENNPAKAAGFGFFASAAALAAYYGYPVVSYATMAAAVVAGNTLGISAYYTAPILLAVGAGASALGSNGESLNGVPKHILKSTISVADHFIPKATSFVGSALGTAWSWFTGSSSSANAPALKLPNIPTDEAKISVGNLEAVVAQ